MYIVRRNSYNPVQNIFLSVFAGNNLKTNIEETDKEYLLTMLVPGVAKKDINIDYEDSYLIISVESKSETEDKKYLVKEIKEESYSRSFYLENINEDKIKAKLEDGVLTIKLEKDEPEIRTRKIKID